MSAPAIAASITVTDVSVSFGGLRALHGVSMTVPRGSVTGLIGPNGSGKSTLVNVVTGHVRPSDGAVSLEGEELSGLAPHKRVHRGLARTFQTPRVKPDSTIFENVVIGAYPSGSESLAGAVLGTRRSRRDEKAAHERAVDVLERFHLTPMMHTPASKVPIWALRIAEIARALMMQPRYVLLDEPAAGTDDETKALLEEVIRDLALSGLAVLLIEHHFAFVSRLSSQLVVLNKGEVLATGTPAEVSADPRVIETYLGVSHK